MGRFTARSAQSPKGSPARTGLGRASSASGGAARPQCNLAMSRHKVQGRASRHGSSAKLRSVLERLDASITVYTDALHITISRGRLAELVGISLPTGSLDDPIQLIVPSALKRRGHELRLVYAASADPPPQRDERLVDLVGRGWAAWQQLSTCERIADPARRSHLTRLARLRFLAPDIVTAILEGRQPVELTARTLLRIADLPLAWSEQRRVLGFC